VSPFLPIPNSIVYAVVGVAGMRLVTFIVLDLIGTALWVGLLIGLGYVLGFSLTRGAIASTVAHDAHNCMIVGELGPAGPADMAVAIARLAELGGGQVAVLDGKVIAEIALPIGGLMSDRPAAAVAAAVEHLEHVAAAELGVTIGAPFMQLSFLGLSVIPELRITDRGLVDVDKFALTTVAPG